MDDIAAILRDSLGPALGSLVRMLRDFDLAEESLQEAAVLAMQRWPVDGNPDRPAAWLVTAARRKALDRLRREAKRPVKQQSAWRRDTALGSGAPVDPAEIVDDVVDAQLVVDDDQLTLLLMCCHPSLNVEAQIALTLRSLAGLSTSEIARAFLVDEATMGQRLVRAKRKIRAAGIPFSRPSADDLADRVEIVCHVIYLVFNEGYASSGESLVRVDLCAEAIRLARLVHRLVPGDPEVAGLLAMMLLHDARRPARLSSRGELVLLEDQDRSLWDRERIGEGEALVQAAMRRRAPGPYQIQAAIAALHSTADDSASTDWSQIASLYGVLRRVVPSPVVELNRAVAVAMADGAGAGLSLIEGLIGRGELLDSHLFHAAHADLLRRMGHDVAAIAAYDRALAFARSEPERRFLEGRRRSLEDDRSSRRVDGDRPGGPVDGDQRA